MLRTSSFGRLCLVAPGIPGGDGVGDFELHLFERVRCLDSPALVVPRIFGVVSSMHRSLHGLGFPSR